MKKNIVFLGIIIAVCLICHSRMNAQTQTITTVAGNGTASFSGDGSAATAGKINRPEGVAVDANAFYISDNLNNRIRKVNSSGVISTIAGDGTAGYDATDNGHAATDAEISLSYGIAVYQGNVYFCDNSNNYVRKISSSGVITSIAGNGTAGSSGDGGAATLAELSGPQGIAIDGSGNIYIADQGNDLIRKINTSGIISSIAGTAGISGFTGDGGAATSAKIHSPYAVAVDGSGIVYIGDVSAHVRRVTSGVGGTISSIAGNGTGGYTGDGGVATNAEIGNITGIAIDGTGNIYIDDLDNNRIRYINSVGIINTYAGNGTGSFGGDGGAPATAELWQPHGVAVDGCGNLYIADYDNNRIRLVGLPSITGTATVCVGSTTTLSDLVTSGTWSSGATSVATVNATGVVTGVAQGTAVITYTLCSNTVTTTVTVNATPAAIAGTLAACVSGTTSLTNTSTGGTWSSSATGTATVGSTTGIVSGVAAGTATITYSNGCGSAATAIVTVDFAGSISGPNTVCNGANICLTASGSTGGTWISGTTTHATVGSSTGVVTGVAAGSSVITYSVLTGCTTTKTVSASICGITTFAGDNTAGNTGDNGAATAAELNQPVSVAIDPSGIVYISDYTSHVIRKVSSGTITTYAGSGSSTYSGDGGLATAAGMSPYGIAVDASGNVYIADKDNSRIREINFSTGDISTIAGTGTSGYTGDGGNATAAKLAAPFAIAIDGNGNILFTDKTNNVVREINSVSHVISTIAGTGATGYSGDGAAATAATFTQASGLAVDNMSNIYIADFHNYVIRKVTSGIISTIAGNNTNSNSGDGGSATLASITAPIGVVTDCSGNVYISDGGNTIRLVNTSGIINTIAGNGTAGYTGNGGIATAAELNGNGLITIDGTGNIYVPDENNYVIREVGPGLCSTCRFGSIQNGNESQSFAVNHYTLYPNPTIGTISILQNREEDGVATVKIFNLLGQAIYSNSIIFADGNAKVNIATPAGVYVVEIRDGKGEIQNLKLVIKS